MLKFYLTTVVIWMIILYSTAAIFSNGIVKKLGTNEEKKASFFKKIKILFMLAAVPIVRLFVVIVMIYVATCKQEDFDKLMEKANKDKS